MAHTRILSIRRHIVPSLLALVALMSAGSFAPVQAAGPTVTLDSPSSGAVLANGRAVHILGWAVDPTAAGTGIDRLDVYLDGPPGTGAYIGTATYGTPRPDVAAAFGRPEWVNCGFTLDWTPQTLSAGSHVLYVSASGASGSASSTVALTASSTLSRSDGGDYGAPAEPGPGYYGLAWGYGPYAYSDGHTHGYHTGWYPRFYGSLGSGHHFGYYSQELTYYGYNPPAYGSGGGQFGPSLNSLGALGGQLGSPVSPFGALGGAGQGSGRR